MEKRVVVDLKSIWKPSEEVELARLELLPEYVKTALEKAGEGDYTVVLTGAGPIWLYLAIAHALHGKVSRLIYNSPTTGDVLVFNHKCKGKEGQKIEGNE